MPPRLAFFFFGQGAISRDIGAISPCRCGKLFQVKRQELPG
jgi:hypothetical protein